jgi:hypothetical protein
MLQATLPRSRHPGMRGQSQALPCRVKQAYGVEARALRAKSPGNLSEANVLPARGLIRKDDF